MGLNKWILADSLMTPEIICLEYENPNYCEVICAGCMVQ